MTTSGINKETGICYRTIQRNCGRHSIMNERDRCSLKRIVKKDHRDFTDSKQSRLCRLKNGVPQGLVLTPLLFNIYTYDLPFMISRKFAYADDLALLHSSGN